jgi:hypothetical protein
MPIAATPWLDNDALFFAQVGIGHRHALHVGTMILAEGLPVQVTKPTLRESVADRAQYLDELDVLVGSRSPVTLEIKSRNLRFTSPADYPFNTAFVDTVSGWNAKPAKPAAVVLVSQITLAALVISVKHTRDSWTTRRGHDGVRNIDDTWYMVPKSGLAPFTTLLKWLKATVS